MKDVLGQAISDYHHRQPKGKLWVNNKYGPREEMPVKVYFREADDMPELEWIALQKCRGRILDIGAGAGSHALFLQKMKHDVTALEISPKSASVMQARGVRKIIQKDFFSFEEQPSSEGTASSSAQETPLPAGFDTLLLLMNGIGLAATLVGLRKFLQYARRLLRPGGQLLFDSSDIAYLYRRKKRPADHYYGEIQYQYEYDRQQSDWFSWLFIDKTTLTSIAATEGWSIEIIFEDGHDQYLAKCELFSKI
ncbi:MAG: class I SAM-dependent methyltransferase [Puia sp.]|nr:class I SAM-dependent methyltransferase [Puia sp.]